MIVAACMIAATESVRLGLYVFMFVCEKSEVSLR